MASKISAADLLRESKQLNNVPEAKCAKSSTAIDTELDPQQVKVLTDIYNKHNGNLDNM